MAKNTVTARNRTEHRNWIAYLCEALVTSGAMPTWEAATYLTENLFGQKPNPRLLTPVNPHEVTSQFLRRLYQPLVEAASREATLPSSATLHSQAIPPYSSSSFPETTGLSNCSYWTLPKPGTLCFLTPSHSTTGQANGTTG